MATQQDAVSKLLANGIIGGKDEIDKPINATGDTALHRALQGGSLADAKLLITAGASINCCNQTNVTPLMVASAKGDLAAVTLLVDSGADLGSKDKDGCTAQECAEKQGKKEVVDYLASKKSSMVDEVRTFL